MKTVKRKILVTAALPYANGDIHLGHLVEYLQTDFWVRFQKMRGHECLYICAADTHGTPVMISANRRGISPEELIDEYLRRHIEDFTDFQIAFDNYYSTNSPENKELSEIIFRAMLEKGHIEKRTIKQSYCEHDEMFLPDRFVTGTCPRCGAINQYGDSCDVCSATYSSFELIDPKCAVCGQPPIEKDSEHLFFILNHFREFLTGWVKTHTSREVTNKLNEWLQTDLRDWDISRDAPYFGFRIPGYRDKYFYVWLDAPVGYMSSTMNWCSRNNRDFSEFWKEGDTELYHFIGKDIVYFHTLFWPAMLHNAEFKTPDQIFVHGFLTVNGEKMSKSKGTFIKARTYIDHLDPLYLRYYYACKMTPSMDDIDLNFDDFIQRVNSDLLGKITNLASRGAQMLNRIDGVIGPLSGDGTQLVEAARQKSSAIAGHYENREFSKVMVEIRNIADAANRYFDTSEPWKSIKTDPEATRPVLSTVLSLFRIIAVYLKPILPGYIRDVEELFNEEEFTWNSIGDDLQDHRISEFKHLAVRIEKEWIERINEDSKEFSSESSAESKGEAPMEEIEPVAEMIGFDDFLKIDLRVAEVIEAEEITESEKLVRLKISIGSGTREIIAGIKRAYRPEDLIGRKIVVVVNLEPRKMKFGTSEGMLLAAGEGDTELFLLSPDTGAKPGQRIR